MRREGEHFWRKKRRGREYGSWHTYLEGRIVNLGTSILDDAKAKAARLMGGAADTHPLNPGGVSRPAAPPASRDFIRNWVAGGGALHSVPVAAPPPAPPPPAGTMAPEIAKALAASFAAGATALYITAIRLGVRYLGDRKPPEATEVERRDIGATMEIALADLFARTAIKPWHVLAVQGGAMAVRMAGEGERLHSGVTGDVLVNRQGAASAEAA